jgi:hypothetical protein
MVSTVVIDCPGCSVRVSATVRGVVHDRESDAVVVLGMCPACNGPIVGLTEVIQTGMNEWEYDHAQRVWPESTSLELNPTIPQSIRRDIADAQKCFSHGIYSAAVVLCGKALERFVKERVPSRVLADGLASLKADGTIDERLYQWATILREERNIGAHASDEDVTKENAQDVLDFTVAIFEYVYTLSEKYAAFLARKGEDKSGDG